MSTLAPVTALDPDTCYRALVSRDTRFDGHFFAIVHTTGIYCRPICPAPKPKRKNVDFVPSAAAAETAGYRACLRCRPESAPGSPDWRGSSALVSRALRRIHDGAMNLGNLEDLSESLGVSSRHLSRLFHEELGATPLEFARTLRAHGAWKLIEQTDMPMTDVAFASGFGSVRSFNEEVRARFGVSPSKLRQRARNGRVSSTDSLQLTLGFRPPYPWDSVLDYLRTRAIPGVELVDGESYRRCVRQEGNHGVIEVRRAQSENCLSFSTTLPISRGLPGLIERVRGVFDLRADPHRIASDLGGAREMRPLIKRNPGLRLVGAWDGFELALRAVIGQQVSLKGAMTLLGRLVELCGDRVVGEDAQLSRVFPTPEQVIETDLSKLGMPGKRREAIRALARAVVEGDLDLDPGSDPETTRQTLVDLPGIGPWTADYILMRGLRHPDAFPAGDLVLRRALADEDETLSTRELERRSEAWRPWRAYAAMWLWKSMSERS